MNHITTSLGERITRKQFDKRITKAKKKKLEMFFEEHGFYFCEQCGKSSCKPIDCSHDIPVSECIKIGQPELAYDTDNITLRGRKCHQEYDGLNIKYSKI